MPTALPPLSQFANNVHSQYGEDGIIAEILRRIAEARPLDRWCVEFGAWDGVYLSNTCNLIRSQGYRAVLIEGNPQKHRALCANMPGAEIVKLCRFVQFEGPSRLDAILKTTPIPPDFDFLSIDIDGCDYFIFESLSDYRPKLVCIEFNPTIPNDALFVQPKDFSVKQGSGPASLTLLAEKKGYGLVAATECNLFFVRREFLRVVLGRDESPALGALRDDSAVRVFLFSGYDGTVLIDKPTFRLPWHGLDVGAQALQQLPRALRRFPSDYGPLQNFLFGLVTAWRFPAQFRRRLEKQFLKKTR